MRVTKRSIVSKYVKRSSLFNSSSAELRIRIAFDASHEIQRMSEETQCVVGNVGMVAVKVLDDLFEFQPFGQTQSDTRPRRLHFCLPEPHVPHTIFWGRHT